MNRRVNRIERTFERLRKTGEKGLVTFITAGDPDLDTTGRLLPLLARAGVDIIELGMPFSDPMADGPTIQRSSERALASGTTLEGFLKMIRNVRDKVDLPIVMMGYSNPVYSYGWQRFAEDAVKAGLDALLLVDLPPEEAGELLPFARKAGLDLIFLLAPTSDEQRIAQVNRIGSGFIYYVTVTGVTGARESIATELSGRLKEIKARCSLPLVAGFGISTPQQAAEVAPYSDGVVVGSAIVKLFEQYSGKQLEQEVVRLVSSLKQGISVAAGKYE